MRPTLLHRLSTLVLCITLLSAIVAASGGDAKVGKLPKEQTANHQIQTLDGQNFSLASLRGKVVVLDFFAVWCGHSKKHIPTMTEFGEAESQRGLQIIGLAVKDADSTPDRVRKFIEDMKIPYPVGLIADPDFVNYVESRDVSVPQTLVYGRDGRLLAHFSGHDNATSRELNEVVMRELEKR